MSEVKKIEPISEAQIKANGVVSLAVRPNQPAQYGAGSLSAKELQKRFDNLSRLAIVKLNALVQLLAGEYLSDQDSDPKSILEYILAFKGDESETLTEDLTLKDVLDRILTKDAELKVQNPYAAITSYIKLNTVIAEIVSDISKNAQYISSLATDIETNSQNIYSLEDDLSDFRDAVNNTLNSDDETLDQTKEIVDYIKSNKSLIDAITTSKVSVSDIIDNLKTNASDKPLSAAQGVELKRLIDEISINGGGSGTTGGFAHLSWNTVFNENAPVFGIEMFIESIYYYGSDGKPYYDVIEASGVKTYNLYGDFTTWQPFELSGYTLCFDNSHSEPSLEHDGQFNPAGLKVLGLVIPESPHVSYFVGGVVATRWLQPTAAEGDLTAVFDELHDYAQGIISGVSE